MKNIRLVGICLALLPLLAAACKPRVADSALQSSASDCPECPWLASSLTELNEQLQQEGVSEVVAKLDDTEPSVEGFALDDASSELTLAARISIIQAQAEQIKASIATRPSAQTDRLNKTLEDLGGILRELNNSNAVPPAPGSAQAPVADAISLIQSTLTQTKVTSTGTAAPTPLICSTLSSGYFLPHAKDTGVAIGASGVSIETCRRLVTSQRDGLICTTLSNGYFLPFNLAANKNVGSSGMSLDACLKAVATMSSPVVCSTLASGYFLPHDLRSQKPIGSSGMSFDSCTRSVAEFKQGFVCSTLSSGYYLPHQVEPLTVFGSAGVSADTCSRMLKDFNGSLLCSTLSNGNYLPTTRDGKNLGQCGMSYDQCASTVQKQADGLLCTTLSNCTFLPMAIATGKVVGSAGTSVAACLQSIGR